MEEVMNIGIAIDIPSGSVCADRLLKERAVYLVLLALNLPDAGGMDFIRRVHDEGIDVDILPVTVEGSQEVLLEAFHAGVVDYVLKRPGYLGELPRVVRRVLHSRQLELRNRELITF